MPYHERCGNIHIHTTFSDGAGSYEDVAQAADAAGLDYVIVTDHNAFHPEKAGWYGRTLVLVGQEVHDLARPGVNHLLVIGAGQDLSGEAGDLQGLIDAARGAGGLAYLAHPIEHTGAYLDEPEINWADRQVHGYHGIELWNYMSEFKSHLGTRAQALVAAFWPTLAIRGPYAETLRLWDELLQRGAVCAIGGSDAHAKSYTMGPLRREVFTYRHLFGAVNTHLLLSEPWSGVLAAEEALVHDALLHGRGFVGYDRLAPTHGTHLLADNGSEECTFGERVQIREAVWLKAQVPAKARLRLVCNGAPVRESQGRTIEYRAQEPGVYRLEAYRRYLGRERGWVFGNPIRVENVNHRAE